MPNLFRKKIDPRCVYCARGLALNPNEIVCAKRGVVEAYSACRHFKYDPLKRVPPKPVQLGRNYDDSDFLL